MRIILVAYSLYVYLFFKPFEKRFEGVDTDKSLKTLLKWLKKKVRVFDVLVVQ